MTRTPSCPLLGALLLLAVSLTNGCSSPPPQQDSDLPPLPSPEEFRSRTPQPPSGTQPGEKISPFIITRITRFDFALDADLRPAEKQLTKAHLPLDQLDLWRMNGLFAGVLPQDKLPSFMASLPQTLGGETQYQMGGEQFSTISLTPGLGNFSPQVVLTRSDGREYPTVISGGRCQFLWRVLPSLQGAFLAELTPQHHVAKYTIQPRLPQEKELDGTIFQDLTLLAPLQRQQTLVVGMVVTPEPPEPPIDPTPLPRTQPATTRPATSQPMTQSASTSPPKIQPPRYLGTLLLGYSRLGRPVKALLLIQVLQESIPQRPQKK